MKPSHTTKPYRKNFEYASTKLAEPTVHAHFYITKAHQTPSQETSPKLFFLLFHIRQTKDHLPSLIYSIVCEWGKRLLLLMLNKIKKKLLCLAYIFWPLKMRRCNERPRPAGPPSSHTHESTTAWFGQDDAAASDPNPRCRRQAGARRNGSTRPPSPDDVGGRALSIPSRPVATHARTTRRSTTATAAAPPLANEPNHRRQLAKYRYPSARPFPRFSKFPTLTSASACPRPPTRGAASARRAGPCRCRTVTPAARAGAGTGPRRTPVCVRARAGPWLSPPG